MASFLFRILCCLGKRPRDQTIIPDESSRLIPATAEGGIGDTPGTNASIIDRGAYLARLDGIVRSKEGIMVNVSSPLPFNLHHKPQALIDVMRQGSFLSSSSRSASASTFHESQSPVHRPRPPPFRIRSGLRITPLHSAPHSRSRSGSQSSISTTASSHAEKSSAPPGVLGVRFIHGLNPGYAQRGRAGIESSSPATAEFVSDAEQSSTSQIQNTEAAEQPQVSISPASVTFEFRLNEVGALSASWGD